MAIIRVKSSTMIFFIVGASAAGGGAGTGAERVTSWSTVNK